MKRDWQKEFDQKLYEKFKGSVKRLSPYINKFTMIKFEHRCGNVYMAAPKGVLKSKVGACTECRKKNTGNHHGAKAKSNEQFIREVEALVGDAYIFLDPYTRAHDKIRCCHNKCGTIFLIKPNSFLNGTRCPNIDCIPKKPYKSQEEVDNEIRSLTHNEYQMIEPYKGDGVKVMFRHNKCGYEWKIKPNDIINKHGCPKCAHAIPWTTEIFKDFVKEVEGDEYTVMGIYKEMNTLIIMRHNKCGKVYKVKPASFKSGSRCPQCRASSGELTIMHYLDELGCNYEEQKWFSDCRDKYPLPFDFYLPDYNLIIEYDGRQHFEPIEFFGGKKSFQIYHKHDLIKNKYCEDNDINLLRIPYTVTGEDIGKVIQNKLDELKQLDNVA